VGPNSSQAMHAALKIKNKKIAAVNQDNMSEFERLLFQ